jgi:glycosyltransferase involved in cell wall biosynthesis
MRLMFVYWKLENSGSAQTIYNYAIAAKEMGHEVVLYAPEDPHSRFHCSQDIESADAVIFLLEWNIYLHNNEPLDLENPVKRSARKRRIVIDDDGMYSDVIRVDGDYNHPDVSDSRARCELYESIADRIYQPTLHPVRPGVGTFLFHGYNPNLEIPLDFQSREYGMFYVGSNWFRWRGMSRVLRAIEPIRNQVGRIGLAGHNWEGGPWWVEQPLRDDAYFSDPAYLKRLDVELMPAIPIEEVVPSMSKAVFNPVLVRPTFNHMRLVNPRMFETPAAGTIPVFGLDREHVEEIYGEDAGQLVMNGDATEWIADVLRRPGYYAEIVKGMRERLARKHSFAVRMQELLEIVRSGE